MKSVPTPTGANPSLLQGRLRITRPNDATITPDSATMSHARRSQGGFSLGGPDGRGLAAAPTRRHQPLSLSDVVDILEDAINLIDSSDFEDDGPTDT